MAGARAADPGGLSWMPQAPEASSSEPGGSRKARLWPASRKAMTCSRSDLVDAPTWLPPQYMEKFVAPLVEESKQANK